MTNISWKTGTSGSWGTAADWSTGTVPDTSDTAIINAAPSSGSYTITIDSSISVGGLVLDQAAATLDVGFYDTLTVGGTLSLEAGTLAIDGGAIDAGTIVASGGTLFSNYSATLSASAVKGKLLIEGQSFSDSFSIYGNLTMAPASGSAASTITVDDTGLYFNSNGATIANGTLQLENATLDNDAGNFGSTATLQLASNLIVDVSGKSTLASGLYGNSGSTAILNDGMISITGAGASLAAYNYGTFTNAGKITVADGASLNFLLAPNPDIGAPAQSFADFTNSGVITVAAGGFLGLTLDATFSNTGTITDAGTLALGGTYTTANALSVGLAATGTLEVAGIMTNTGQTLTAGTGGGISGLLLNSGPDDTGTIEGGTVVNLGGFQVLYLTDGESPYGSGGATLSAVTLDGPLTIGSDGTVTLANDTVLHGVNGKGNGTIVFSGADSSLLISGSQTLTGLTVSATESSSAIDLIDPVAGTPITLTLAGTTNLDSAPVAFIGSFNGAPTGDTLLNTGILDLGAALSTSFETLNFTNTGSISVESASVTLTGSSFLNSGSLAISGASSFMWLMAGQYAESFDNSKLLSIGSGDTLLIGGGYDLNAANVGFQNTGTIQANGGTLALETDLATAALGSIEITDGGVLDIAGTLSNAGSTLKIGTGSTFANVAITGQIAGGTITAAATGVFFGEASLPGFNENIPTLSDVTFLGPLELNQADESLNIENGITLRNAAGSAAGSINFTGAGSTLTFDTETLAAVSISIGAAGAATELNAGGSATLTLAKSVTITQVGLAAVLNGGGGTLVNDGTMRDSIANGILTLFGTLQNAGSILISNGATLNLDETSLENSGTISISSANLDLFEEDISILSSLSLTHTTLQLNNVTATGETLTAGAGSAITLAQITGVVDGGTLHDTGGGVQFYGEGVELVGVTYQGSMSITRPYTTVHINSGLTDETLAGTGPGTITLTGAGSVLAIDDTTPLNNATIEIGNNAASYDGVPVAAPAITANEIFNGPYGYNSILTLGGNLTLNQVGAYASVGAAGNMVDSAASIDAAFAQGNFLLQGAAFTNTGSIAISNAGTVTAAAAFTLNAGAIAVTGSAAALNLDTAAYFQSGSLSPYAFENSGTIALAGGMLDELTAGGAFPDVPVLNTGKISGNGTLAAAVINTGSIVATGGTLTLTQQVGGSGLLEASGAALVLTGGAASGVIAHFAGAHAELGLAPPSFLGSIAGFASGDTLDLLNEAAKAASFSGDSIIVTLTAGGTISLATTTALTGTLAAASDGHGGSLITFAAPADQLPGVFQHG